MTYMRFLTVVLSAAAAVALGAQTPPQPAPAQPPPTQPQQQSAISTRITAGTGMQPRIAVPDFIPLSSDTETAAAAKTVARVLWDDLAFEREFYLIPRDTYQSIAQPASLEQVALDRWKELGADGVVVGSVRKTATGVTVQVRLMDVSSGASVLAKEYTGSIANPRLFAHTISDEIHQTQVALRGVARTKLAFSSDRDGERTTKSGSPRDISNIYTADYDGANERRLTITRALDIAPVWSPDRTAIAYMSYRTGYPDIIVHPLAGGRYTTPARGTADNRNYLPAWSPDGTRLAFMSSRDGDPEIYVVNRDGGGLRRLTSNPANDVTPTWSPTGTQIAFTSDRSGNPQIYIINVDGTGLERITSESHCDRPTWSPAPWNEIAYSSRAGAGNNIRIFDFATRSSKAVTDGIGNNESPAFAPNGRHLAFVSSRAGKDQIFTIARDGQGLRQITRTGANKYPNWSQ